MLTNRIVCHLAKRKAALVSPKGVCFQIENKASPKIYTALKNKKDARCQAEKNNCLKNKTRHYV